MSNDFISANPASPSVVGLADDQPTASVTELAADRLQHIASCLRSEVASYSGLTWLEYATSLFPPAVTATVMGASQHDMHDIVAMACLLGTAVGSFQAAKLAHNVPSDADLSLLWKTAVGISLLSGVPPAITMTTAGSLISEAAKSVVPTALLSLGAKMLFDALMAKKRLDAQQYQFEFDMDDIVDVPAPQRRS